MKVLNYFPQRRRERVKRFRYYLHIRAREVRGTGNRRAFRGRNTAGYDSFTGWVAD